MQRWVGLELWPTTFIRSAAVSLRNALEFTRHDSGPQTGRAGPEIKTCMQNQTVFSNELAHSERAILRYGNC